MADLVLFLVYIGGWNASPGFWKGMFWPYYLGAHLARLALTDSGNGGTL